MKDDLTNTMLKLYTFSEVVTKQGMQQQGDEVATKQVMKERKKPFTSYYHTPDELKARKNDIEFSIYYLSSRTES